MEDFNPRAKQGLLDLCVGLAEALGAESFALRCDDSTVKPLDTQAVVKTMRSQVVEQRDWSIAGVRSSVLSLRELEKARGKHRSIYSVPEGYTVVDYLALLKY